MGVVANESPAASLDLAREAFDRSAVGLMVLDTNGILLQVNRAFCAITGYAREELEGRPFLEITHPDDRAKDEESMRSIRSGAEPPVTVDKRYVRKDGSEVWVRRSAAVVRDSAGVPRVVVGAVVDLTEQRAKDRSLYQMNGFLRAIVEASPVAIYATDTDGLVTFWNPAAERIFGFTREHAIGRPAPFVPDAKREESREIDARVLAGGMVDGLQVERVRADGSPIVIRGSAAPLRDADERVNGVLVACVDVTEARQAADELERQMHFSRAVIDAIPNPVYFKDREGRYTMHNRAWGELFAGGENWIGKTVFDMYGPDIAAAHHERDRALLERPSSTTYEVLMPTALGETRQMLYNKVSFVDQKGEVAGLIGTVTDVTRYKETERALEASEARFRVLTESSLDLISVIDADGTLRYQSGALRTLLGYDPADTMGRNVFDLCMPMTPSISAPRCAASWRRASRAGRSSCASATATARGARSSPSAPTASPTRTSTAWCSTRATSPTAR